MAILLAFILVYLACLLFKGINININITHKHEQQPKEEPKYNESLVDLLPNDVKQYYHDNQGQNRF